MQSVAELIRSLRVKPFSMCSKSNGKLLAHLYSLSYGRDIRYMRVYVLVTYRTVRVWNNYGM